MKKPLQPANMRMRNAELGDIPGIQALMSAVYPDMPAYTTAMLRGQISNFPEGQFVAEVDGEIAGYCATFRIAESVALADHTWTEITGGGFASRHDPDGSILYGMEVAVHPTSRGLRLGRRLYNERKRLCDRLGLAGVAFVGRLPGLARRLKDVGSAEVYVQRVLARQLRDSVLSFQLRNGFEFIRIIPNYLQSDKSSLGNGALMLWRNPRQSHLHGRSKKSEYANAKKTVRVATVQYQQRQVSSFEEFGRNVEYFVDVVSDYGTDFVLFPELFTLQLLSSISEKVPADRTLKVLTGFTERFTAFMSTLAVKYNVNIVGGSHPSLNAAGEARNTSYVFLRNGAIHAQEKIHATPNEVRWWGMKGGNDLAPISTDCGQIGVLICYDCEFPELARHLVDQGAQILFVPFCTDTREGYNRVRYCAQARAIENQLYVVMAGNVGNLPNVANMDIQYAQSCILEPSDFGFARDGIAADTTPNTEMVAIADLRLEALSVARNAGTVRNLRDRRFDLYSVKWNT